MRMVVIVFTNNLSYTAERLKIFRVAHEVQSSNVVDDFAQKVF